MIGYVEGVVSHLFPDSCFINVGGVGYRVCLSASSRASLAVGSSVRLFTNLCVREDALTLYGFKTLDECGLFSLLMNVQGIGPKLALALVSDLPPAALRRAIALKDTAALTRVPGVGKKTAERLILELKDKIGGQPAGEENTDIPVSAKRGEEMDPSEEAAMALSALGYDRREAETAVRQVAAPGQTVEEMVKLALRALAQRR